MKPHGDKTIYTEVEEFLKEKITYLIS